MSSLSVKGETERGLCFLHESSQGGEEGRAASSEMREVECLAEPGAAE